jgi:hypothetical protein
MTTTHIHSMSETRARRLYAALTDPKSADPMFTIGDIKGLTWYPTFEEFCTQNSICIQIDLGYLDVEELR